MALLRRARCLNARASKDWGGACLGWRAISRVALVEALQAMGGVHLSTARLFEGHVNAFQLLWTYGSQAQREMLCAYVHNSGLSDVWNAAAPEGQLRLSDRSPSTHHLEGPKASASGAGHIERPLLTAKHERLDTVMAWPHNGYLVGPDSDWSSMACAQQ